MTHRLGQTAKSDRTLCYFGGNPRKENPLLKQASSRIDEVRRSGRLPFTASSSEHEKKGLTGMELLYPSVMRPLFGRSRFSPWESEQPSTSSQGAVC